MRSQKATRPTIARNAIPPTTPPAIAPAFDLDFLDEALSEEDPEAAGTPEETGMEGAVTDELDVSVVPVSVEETGMAAIHIRR